MEFDQKTHEELGAYVYGLFDPADPRWPFYIGKGSKNRLFEHARGLPDSVEDHAQLSQKLRQINDIRSAGKSVIHKILRFGLTDDEALKIEASMIDLVNYIRPDTSQRDGVCNHVPNVSEIPELNGYTESTPNVSNGAHAPSGY